MRTASESGAPLSSLMMHFFRGPYLPASSAVSSSNSSSTSPAPTMLVSSTIRVGDLLSFALLACCSSGVCAARPRFGAKPLARLAPWKLRLPLAGPVTVKRPSTVDPTKSSPTASKRSLAGIKAQAASLSSPFTATPDIGASAANSSKWRSASPSWRAHSATSRHNPADSRRTSLSVAGAASSVPRGRTSEMTSRQRFAHSEKASSALPPLSGWSGPSEAHSLLWGSCATRLRNLCSSSCQTQISGNCAITACQVPRTQLSFLLASACEARFSAQRNCARRRLGAQS
mmetsp:Transcript_727/g.2005  ORF Transcript_727/g.2005 Transcript_727/m.2005 type:complete len:287 (+) Transcript_727:447-1307(+)